MMSFGQVMCGIAHGDLVRVTRTLNPMACHNIDMVEHFANCGWTNQLSLAHVNVQSLNHNYDSVRDVLLETGFDVFALSETWLGDAKNASYYPVDGYRLVAGSSAYTNGAGVAIYVKSAIDCRVVLSDICSGLDIDAICVELKIGTETILISSLYRHFRCSQIQCISSLDDLFQALHITGKNFFLLGDINIDLLTRSSIAKRYEGLLSAHGLFQCINKPTRVTPYSSTLIDHIITNSRQSIAMSDSYFAAISDHNVVACRISLPKPQISNAASVQIVRDMRNYDAERYLQSLAWVPFHHVRGDDANAMASQFMSILLPVVDEHAPLAIRHFDHAAKRPKPPSDNLIDAWTTAKKYHHWRYKHLGIKDAYPCFAHFRKLIKQRLKQLRTEKTAQDLASCSDSKEIWRVSKRVCGLTDGRAIPLVNLEEAAVHFGTVGDKTAQAAQLLNVNNVSFQSFMSSDQASNVSFAFDDVTEADIYSAVAALKDKAPGEDAISRKLILHALPVIVYPLKRIFNASLRTGTFPSVWKHALVTLIYKSGEKNKPVSYRPISLLALFGKILEYIVNQKIRSFLEENNRLPKTQSGFRLGHSTETALMKLFSDMCSAIDRKRIFMVLSLDFSKAFDTVDHAILAHKLEYHGIRGTALNWFKSFLADRTQQIRVGDNLSRRFSVSTGVPQGAILSPLLFTLFTSDLPSCLQHCSHYAYADDTQLAYDANTQDMSSAIQMMERDFENVVQWSSSNLLKLNVSKTEFFVAHSRYITLQPVHLTLGGNLFEPKPCIRILGVLFDRNLTFENHANAISAKVTGFLRMLASRRKYLPRFTLKLLVNAYVSSRIQYCLSFLGTSPAVLKRYQLLQNFAVRTIFGLPKFSHVSNLRESLDWRTVAEEADYRFGILMWKSIRGTSPAYLHIELENFAPTHEFDTRSEQLRRPPSNNRYGDCVFGTRCVDFYNDSQDKTIWNMNFAKFRRKLQKLIIEARAVDL
jgi:hypothetical protein